MNLPLALRDRHVRVSPSIIRQQPEYKAILAKMASSSTSANQPTTEAGPVARLSTKSAFLPDALLARQAYAHSRSSEPQSSDTHGTSEVVGKPDASSGSPTRTSPASTNPIDAFDLPRPFDQTDVGAQSRKVIMRGNNDMGLSRIRQKYRRRFSWHEPSSTQKTKKSTPMIPRPEFRTVLVCQMTTRKVRRSQTFHEIESLKSIDETRPALIEESSHLSEDGTKGPLSSVDIENKTTDEENNDVSLSVEQEHVDEKALSGSWDKSEAEAIKEIRNDKVDRLDETGVTIDAPKKTFNDRAALEPKLSMQGEISSTKVINNTHDAAVKQRSIIAADEHFSAKLVENTITPSPTIEETRVDSLQRKESSEHRASTIQFSDDADYDHKNVVKSQLKRTQSTGSIKVRPQSAICEPTASGYDAKLEKSAVYLHSRSQTFTRASQYMEGNRRGLSLLNVHYSQTNTGFNDRIIFSDLLKSAHISNAVISDSVFTMERRLYNRRQDPARSTTFYDRFSKSERSNSGKRQRSKSVSEISVKDSREENSIAPVSARTVADKQKARKERIRQKKEKIEVGYTPTMANLKVPTSRDMEAMLLSCRYLRVQPHKQPWLYDAPEKTSRRPGKPPSGAGTFTPSSSPGGVKTK